MITDRFYDGDFSNNNADGNYDPAGHSGTSVHGGDFKNIEQKLDYIKTLGATAIRISDGNKYWFREKYPVVNL